MDITINDTGSSTGRGTSGTALLLHGGGGPATVLPFADLLADTAGMRVLTPVHPGFEGTPRPESVATVRDLATLYLELLDERDLVDVTVIGSSLGGWIAAEIALLPSDRVGRVVLVDAVGLDVPEDPTVRFFDLTMPEVIERSYYRPENARITPNSAQQANLATLRVYGGETMVDPSLHGRLSGATVPALAVWGEADRIVPPSHGRIFADDMPKGRFELVPEAGHLPQLEAPETLARLIREFAA